MKNIIIVGSSGHAKVIIDTIEKEHKYKISGLIDKFRRIGDSTLGYSILGKEEDLPILTEAGNIQGVVVGIGDNAVRERVVKKIKRLVPELEYVNIIHPSVSIGRSVCIGEGTVIMPGVIINVNSEIGKFCILNTNSSLDHDSRMEDFSSLAPGVITGGNCTIGRASAICLGVKIIHKINIGNNTVIGAGSLVMKSIGSNKLAYGIPAKIVHDRKRGEKYL